MDTLGFAATLLGVVGFLGYCVLFVWASFHTRPGISQARSLFVSWTVLDSSNYTERGRVILRRMWLSFAAGLLFMLAAVGISGRTDPAEPAGRGDSPSDEASGYSPE